MAEYFIREIELENGTLDIHQQFVGDVGCVVWDAALALAKYIDGPTFKRKHNLDGKNVLELGAGTGIVGLTAAMQGANVTITDLKDFVPLMEKNIHHNKQKFKWNNVQVTELKWGDTLDTPTSFDYILMADLIYYEESISALINTVLALSSNTSRILMSFENRTTGNKPQLQKRFFELAKCSFTMEEVPLKDQDPIYSSEDILIYEMKRC